MYQKNDGTMRKVLHAVAIAFSGAKGSLSIFSKWDKEKKTN